MYSCAFIGHKNCSCDIKEKLFAEIEHLIIAKGVTDFYVGTQGNFDRYVYEVLTEIEKKREINIRVVLAYLTAKNNYTYYDSEKTIFPDCLTNTPPRFAISKRNNYMIRQSKFLICYLNNRFSNTFCFVEQALKQNIKVINIGNLSITNAK